MSEIYIPPWFGGEDLLVQSLGDTYLVAYSWASNPKGDTLTINDLLVWHYCDRNVWLKNPKGDPDVARKSKGFTPAGAGLHTLVSIEPLHLEPSLYWPDCCGMHGFIRDGKWVNV